MVVVAETACYALLLLWSHLLVPIVSLFLPLICFLGRKKSSSVWGRRNLRGVEYPWPWPLLLPARLWFTARSLASILLVYLSSRSIRTIHGSDDPTHSRSLFLLSPLLVLVRKSSPEATFRIASPADSMSIFRDIFTLRVNSFVGVLEVLFEFHCWFSARGVWIICGHSIFKRMRDVVFHNCVDGLTYSIWLSLLFRWFSPSPFTLFLGSTKQKFMNSSPLEEHRRQHLYHGVMIKSIVVSFLMRHPPFIPASIILYVHISPVFSGAEMAPIAGGNVLWQRLKGPRFAAHCDYNRTPFFCLFPPLRLLCLIASILPQGGVILLGLCPWPSLAPFCLFLSFLLMLSPLIRHLTVYENIASQVIEMGSGSPSDYDDLIQLYLVCAPWLSNCV